MQIFDMLKNKLGDSIRKIVDEIQSAVIRSESQLGQNGFVRAVLEQKNKLIYVEPDIDISGYKTVGYFRNGKAYKIVPMPPISYYENRDMLYDADAIVSDGVLYDLSDTESINGIPIPNFTANFECSVSNELGITGSLDYILRMKAGRYYDKDECELCSACLWKSAEMMLANSGAWSVKDYMRLVYWHYELNMPAEAEKALSFLEEHDKGLNSCSMSDGFDASAKANIDFVIQQAQKYGSDLIAFHDYGHGCCEKCATMIGRAYSISGKSLRFPALPEYVKKNGNFHEGCRCCASVFFEGSKIYHHGKQTDAYSSSMRSYVDDRTNEEYEDYERSRKSIEKYDSELFDRLERSILRGKNRGEFLYFANNHPDIAPKTIDGYIKGKRTNSKKFQQLVKMAKQDGVDIDTEI